MKMIALGILAALLATSLQGEEQSPITSREIAPDNSPAAVEVARKLGAASAARDIAAGRFRILYYGIPWSVGKPLVDDRTGYQVQVIGGCVVSEPFVAEVNAYNEQMRAHRAATSPPAGTGAVGAGTAKPK